MAMDRAVKTRWIYCATCFLSSVASPGAPGFRTGGRWAHESQLGKSQWTLCASDGLGPIFSKGWDGGRRDVSDEMESQKRYNKVRKMLKV